MRGEEKPYEMPIAEEQEEDMEEPAFTVPTVSAASVASAAAVTAASAATAASVATSAEKTKQKLCKNSFTNNFAIQQRLQHLSPVHPKSLTVQGNLLWGIDNKTVRRKGSEIAFFIYISSTKIIFLI